MYFICKFSISDQVIANLLFASLITEDNLHKTCRSAACEVTYSYAINSLKKRFRSVVLRGENFEAKTSIYQNVKQWILKKKAKVMDIYSIIQWRYSPTGLWPTERPPPVSEASANFCG